MKTSTDRILTTHVGSLARPTDLLDTMKEKENGRSYDPAVFDQLVADAVADRVRRQVESGIDIVADGEMSKVSFIGYVKDRLGGFEVDMGPSKMAPSWQAEFDQFPEYYTEYFKKYSSAVAPLRRIICKSPITYVGHELLQKDIANLKAAVEGLDVTEVFMPSSGPSGFGRNAFYDSHEEYLGAVAEAMREEYLGIVDAGFLLQVDDPWLIDTLSDPARTAEERDRAANAHVDAVNHALRTSRRIACATTRATASTTVRVSPTSHCVTRFRTCCASTPARTRSRSPTRATCTSTGSGRTSSCPTTRSSSRA